MILLVSFDFDLLVLLGMFHLFILSAFLVECAGLFDKYKYVHT